MIWSSEGFLLKRGSLDFAVGGVVYISSGVAGFVGALIVGARKVMMRIKTRILFLMLS